MKKSAKQSAPTALVNSSIAMVPVLCGLLVYDQLSRGHLGSTSLTVALFCLLNLGFCILWPKVQYARVKQMTFYLSVSIQWGYVVAVTSALFFGVDGSSWKFQVLGLGVCGGALAFASIGRGSKRDYSANILSVSGILITASWGGLALNAERAELTPEFKAEIKIAASGNALAPTVSESPFTNQPSRSISPDASLWTYSGPNGPSQWWRLNEDFKTCGTGQQQSPIDIPRRANTKNTKIAVNYIPDKIAFFSNGRTLQMNITEDSHVLLDGHRYRLTQLLYHTPSEHTISGLMYPMEFQFVHSDQEGRSAILSVLVEKGREHAEVAKISNMLTQNEEIARQTPNGLLNLSDLLPKDKIAWTYQGSETTPPCKEGVAWVVFKKTIELSESQIAAFRTVHANNARPVQPTYERSFEQSSQQFLQILSH